MAARAGGRTTETAPIFFSFNILNNYELFFVCAVVIYMCERLIYEMVAVAVVVDGLFIVFCVFGALCSNSLAGYI